MELEIYCVSGEDGDTSDDDMSNTEPRTQRTRRGSISYTEDCSSTPPKRKKPNIKEQTVEEIYKQVNAVKMKSTSLETIYERPKNFRDPSRNLMSGVKTRRMCLMSEFYKPSKSKVRARKERAKKLKRLGVRIPTGDGITTEQLQALLDTISDDEMNVSDCKENHAVNTSVVSLTPKRNIILPTADVSPFVSGNLIVPDTTMHVQEPSTTDTVMTHDELYNLSMSMMDFSSENDTCKRRGRKGRRSGGVRDFLAGTLSYRKEAANNATLACIQGTSFQEKIDTICEEENTTTCVQFQDINTKDAASPAHKKARNNDIISPSMNKSIVQPPSDDPGTSKKYSNISEQSNDPTPSTGNSPTPPPVPSCSPTNAISPAGSASTRSKKSALKSAALTRVTRSAAIRRVSSPPAPCAICGDCNKQTKHKLAKTSMRRMSLPAAICGVCNTQADSNKLAKKRRVSGISKTLYSSYMMQASPPLEQGNSSSTETSGDASYNKEEHTPKSDEINAYCNLNDAKLHSPECSDILNIRESENVQPNFSDVSLIKKTCGRKRKLDSKKDNFDISPLATQLNNMEVSDYSATQSTEGKTTKCEQLYMDASESFQMKRTTKNSETQNTDSRSTVAQEVNCTPISLNKEECKTSILMSQLSIATASNILPLATKTAAETTTAMAKLSKRRISRRLSSRISIAASDVNDKVGGESSAVFGSCWVADRNVDNVDDNAHNPSNSISVGSQHSGNNGTTTGGNIGMTTGGNNGTTTDQINEAAENDSIGINIMKINECGGAFETVVAKKKTRRSTLFTRSDFNYIPSKKVTNKLETVNTESTESTNTILLNKNECSIEPTEENIIMKPKINAFDLLSTQLESVPLMRTRKQDTKTENKPVLTTNIDLLKAKMGLTNNSDKQHMNNGGCSHDDVSSDSLINSVDARENNSIQRTRPFIKATKRPVNLENIQPDANSMNLQNHNDIKEISNMAEEKQCPLQTIKALEIATEKDCDVEMVTVPSVDVVESQCLKAVSLDSDNKVSSESSLTYTTTLSAAAQYPEVCIASQETSVTGCAANHDPPMTTNGAEVTPEIKATQENTSQMETNIPQAASSTIVPAKRSDAEEQAINKAVLVPSKLPSPSEIKKALLLLDKHKPRSAVLCHPSAGSDYASSISSKSKLINNNNSNKNKRKSTGPSGRSCVSIHPALVNCDGDILNRRKVFTSATATDVTLTPLAFVSAVPNKLSANCTKTGNNTSPNVSLETNSSEGSPNLCPGAFGGKGKTKIMLNDLSDQEAIFDSPSPTLERKDYIKNYVAGSGLPKTILSFSPPISKPLLPFSLTKKNAEKTFSQFGTSNHPTQLSTSYPNPHVTGGVNISYDTLGVANSTVSVGSKPISTTNVASYMEIIEKPSSYHATIPVCKPSIVSSNPVPVSVKPILGAAQPSLLAVNPMLNTVKTLLNTKSTISPMKPYLPPKPNILPKSVLLPMTTIPPKHALLPETTLPPKPALLHKTTLLPKPALKTYTPAFLQASKERLVSGMFANTVAVRAGKVFTNNISKQSTGHTESKDLLPGFKVYGQSKS